MSLSQRPILIIGAGISGLACARILNCHHVPNIVFETFPKSRRQGYGITLRSWAYSHFLERLRISPTVFKAATSTDASVGGNGFVSSTLVDAYTGKPLTRATPARSNSEIESDFFRVNRFRLREYLADSLDIRYEHDLISFESKDNSLVAKFGNGQTVEGSMLVGADGVFSKVRSILYPSIKPTVFPAVVINGQRRLDRSTFDTSLSPYMNSSNVLIGVANNVTLGISINDLTSTHVDISWTYSRPTHTDSNYDPLYKPDRTRDESTTISQTFFIELKELAPLASPFAKFYNTDAARSSKLYNWLMRIIQIPRQDLNSSISFNAILLGDAAHAMPIFAGEGGNHGLLDGVQLGAIIAHHVSLATPSNGLQNIANEFYDGAYNRWMEGIEASVKRLGSIHMPIDKWRKLFTHG